MKQTTTLGAIAVCAICFFLTVPAAFSQRPAGWKAPSELLAGTELSRARVAKKLGIATGEYVVALVSILCGDCERELKKVNDGTISDHFLVVAPAPAKDVAAWRKRLGFKFRVVAVTDRDMEDLGAVMLPTFVLLRNGTAVGVAEIADVVK
ncbi:MAG: hypothetical protein ACRD63_04510 [Pyrinomonadaceae bacterium]